MTTAINTAMRFKWRSISYFGSAAAVPFTAVLMAAEVTTTKVWVIAVVSGLGAGFGALKALFDQSVDTSKSVDTDTV